jgi:hypothetical protein
MSPLLLEIKHKLIGVFMSCHLFSVMAGVYASSLFSRSFFLSSSHATGRAQRASARNMNGIAPVSDPLGLNESEVASSLQADLDIVIPVDSDEHSLSRSNSGVNFQDGTSVNTSERTRGARKHKGKARDNDATLIHVKEEPKSISLLSPGPTLGLVRLFSKIRVNSTLN